MLLSNLLVPNRCVTRVTDNDTKNSQIAQAIRPGQIAQATTVRVGRSRTSS